MSNPIIQRLGETDQLFLEENSAQLALERAQLRLQLVDLSKHKAEKIHFLHEAIALLEQARIEFDDVATAIFVDLSLALVQAYMRYYELTHELKFATIMQQILKPMAHLQYADIYLMLAYACACKQEPALTRHWLTKYCACNDSNLNSLNRFRVFDRFKQEVWFQSLQPHQTS